ELSLSAAAECQRERTALDRQWQQKLERARHDTARAERQYDAVEPENRLVARTLERRWEEAFQIERNLEEEYARFRQQHPHHLTASERAHIATLATNLPAVWQASQAGIAAQRHIVRTLIERLVVWAPGSSPEVTVHLHWSLGTVTEHHLIRPVRSWKQM